MLMMAYLRADVIPPIPETGIEVGLMASSYMGLTFLVLYTIFRRDGVCSSSTVDQYSLSVPINEGVAHITWSQPSSARIVVPVWRVCS